MLSTTTYYLVHGLFYSVVITAIYATLQKGMLLSWVRAIIATAGDKIVAKLWPPQITLDEALTVVNGPYSTISHKGNNLKYFAALGAWKYIQKPLYDCLPCMGGLWTIALSRSFDIRQILIVIGINFIISKALEIDE